MAALDATRTDSAAWRWQLVIAMAVALCAIETVLLWVAAVVATFALALRLTGHTTIALLSALMVATAPAFEALAGQALPYVASYSIFVLGLLLFDRAGLFERETSSKTALACGFA